MPIYQKVVPPYSKGENIAAMKTLPEGTLISRKELIHCGIYGMYSATTNKIRFMGDEYSPSGFGVAHIKRLERSARKCCDGWIECYYKMGDDWISLDDIRFKLRAQKSDVSIKKVIDESIVAIDTANDWVFELY